MQRWELLVGRQVFQPQLLAEGSMFQSYWKAVIGAPSAPPRLMADFCRHVTDGLLEGIALDVLHQGEMDTW